MRGWARVEVAEEAIIVAVDLALRCLIMFDYCDVLDNECSQKLGKSVVFVISNFPNKPQGSLITDN
jgi:hypothetical protein